MEPEKKESEQKAGNIFKLADLSNPLFGAALAKIYRSEIDVSLSFKFRRFWKQVSAHLETYEEARKEILGSLASKNEDGTPKIVNNNFTFDTPEAEREVVRKVTELSSQTVTINDVPQVKLSELRAEGVKLSGMQLELLERLLVADL